MTNMLDKYMLEMYLISVTMQSKLSNTIIVLYLSLVQHGLFSCDNSFFFVISQSFQHFLRLYVISIKYKKIFPQKRKLTADEVCTRAFEPKTEEGKHSANGFQE